MRKFIFFVLIICGFSVLHINAQIPTLTLDLTKPGPTVSPMLYGLMTEEINHSYDGGLYAELIRNRIFKDNRTVPEAWSLVKNDSGSKASIKLMAAMQDNVPFEERRHAISGALTTCLRLTVEKVNNRVGFIRKQLLMRHLCALHFSPLPWPWTRPTRHPARRKSKDS